MLVGLSIEPYKKFGKGCVFMKKYRRTGIIACIALLSIVILSFVYLNISYFRNWFSEFSDQLFLMFLYAVIPFVPAVILRAAFGSRAVKWIAVAATVLGGLCCIIHIIMPETIMNETVVLYENETERVTAYVNEWIFVFTQCTLTSSVPALYCAAFVGKGRAVLLALAPSLMFFLSFCIRYVMVSSLAENIVFIIDQSIMLLIMSAAFAVWALLVIFISLMIYKFINLLKIKVIS